MIKIQELHFNGGTTIEVDDAEIIVLVGPNNAGKTRTLQEIQLFLSQNPGQLYDPKSFFVLDNISVQKTGTRDELNEWLKVNRYSWTRPDSRAQMIRTVGTGEVDLQQLTGLWSQPIGALGHLANHLVRALYCGERLGYISAPGRLDIGAHPDHPLQLLIRDKDLLSAFRAAFWNAFHKNIIVDAWGNSIRLRLSAGETQGDFAAETSDGLPVASVVERLSRLQLIEQQSDGVRSFTGILLTLLASRYPLVLIDEPEAFLHPPQARLLGRYLAELHGGGQIFVSTHSLDVLLGLIEARPEKALIVRLARNAESTSATTLAPAKLSELWSDPLLRFSRVLDGLFHEGVVVCEGDTDSQFYSTVAGRKNSDQNSVRPDVMFTYAGSKHRIPLATKALCALGVPVRAVVDFDALNNEHILRSLVEGIGGDYSSEIAKDRRLVDSHLRGSAQALNVRSASEAILNVLGQEPERPLTSDMIGKIRAIMEPETGWRAGKKSGKSAVPAGDATVAVDRLLNSLWEIGISVVPIGEVESFVKTVGGKGPQWAVGVIEKGLIQYATDAHQFVDSIISSLAVVQDPGYIATSS